MFALVAQENPQAAGVQYEKLFDMLLKNLHAGADFIRNLSRLAGGTAPSNGIGSYSNLFRRTHAGRSDW